MYYAKNWGPYAVVVGHEDDMEHRYNRYIRGMLIMELERLEDSQVFLDAMDQAARMGGETEIQFNDRAWGMNVRPTTVHIWSTEVEEWEDSFSHAEVRAVMEGWIKLLQMPDSEESQVIVDLGENQ